MHAGGVGRQKILSIVHIQILGAIMEKKLKEIFDLMYKRLTEIAIGNGFFKRIDRAKNIDFKEIRKRGDDLLFERLIKTIFSGGFNSTIVSEKWSNIRKVFDDFDIIKIADYDEEKINQIISTPSIIKNERKIGATVSNAKKITEIQAKYGSFANYLESFANPLLLANDLTEEFEFIGRETVWDFLKSVGFEAIKPDVHVRRILFRLGLTSSWESSPKTTKEVFEIAGKISKAIGERLGVVDAIIWSYGADRRKEIEKPICGLSPLCDECYVTRYCKYYLNACISKEEERN